MHHKKYLKSLKQPSSAKLRAIENFVKKIYDEVGLNEEDMLLRREIADQVQAILQPQIKGI